MSDHGTGSQPDSRQAEEHEEHEEPVQLTDELVNSSGVGLRQRANARNTDDEDIGPTEKSSGDSEPGNHVPMRRRGTTTTTRSMASRDLQPIESIDVSIPKEPREKLWKRAWKWLRPGYVIDHMDKESFLTILPTWVQVWVSILVMIIPSSGKWMGQTVYLMPLFAMIEVSGGFSVMLNIVLSLAVLVFVMVTWVHVLIAQAIAWHIRGQPTQADVVRQLIIDGVCKNDETLTTCVAETIFHGYFLETKTTVIYIIAMIFGYLILGFMKVNLALTPAFIISSIILNILMCYMPAFPYFDIHTVSVPILKAVGLMFCVRVACAIVFMPKSSNRMYVGGMTKCLGGVGKMAQGVRKALAEERPSRNFAVHQELSASANGILGNIARMELLMKLLGLEVSFSRFDQGDAGEIRAITRGLTSWVASYAYFYMGIQERLEVIRQDLTPLYSRRTSVFSSASARSSKLFAALRKSYKPIGEFEDNMHKTILDLSRMDFDPDSALTLEDMDHMMDFIDKRYGRLLQSMVDTLGAAVAWLNAANNFRLLALLRWSTHKRIQQERSEALKAAVFALHKELDASNDVNWNNTVTSEASRGKLLLPLLGQGSLYSFITKHSVELVLNLANLCLSIDDHRPTPRLITPFTKSLRAIPSVVMDLGDENQDDIKPDQIDGFVPYSRTEARDPDTSPARSIWHLVGKQIMRFAGIIYHPDFLFNLKRAVCIAAVSTPFWCRTSIWVVYHDHLVWITVMAALSVNPTTGDTIYSMIARACATFGGVVIGLVSWYISTGRGAGNYYGLAATTFVVFFFLAYYRHFAIHMTPQPTIVVCVTIILTWGTSWVDTHQNPISNIGHGFHVAWTRFVTVLAGLVAGFIATLLPKPKTGKKMVRLMLGRTLQELGNLTCDVAKFSLQRMENPSLHITLRNDTITKRLRAVLMKIATADRLITTLKYEPSLTGPWPMEKYRLLARYERDLFTLHGLLYQVLNQIDDPEEWMPRLFGMYGWSKVELSADYFAVISMASRSLVLPAPLPRVTPAQTTVKHMNFLRENSTAGSTDYTENSSLAGAVQSEEAIAAARDHLVRNVDFDSVLSHDGQLGLVGLVLMHSIYEILDKTMVLVKSLVGEEYDADLNMYAFDIEDPGDVDMLRFIN